MKRTQLKPWNWFGSENDDKQNSFSLPSRKEAWYALNAMQDQMEELFHSMQQTMPWPKTMIKPDMDIRETKNSYEITTELPGMDEKDITVEISDHSLIIKGEKKAEHEEGDEDSDFHRIERSYGSVRRVLNLPENVNTEEEAEASFDKGVLTVKLTRIPREENTRRIPIKPRKAA